LQSNRALKQPNYARRIHLTVRRIIRKKPLRYVLLPCLRFFIGLAIYFYGNELPIALILASGIQRASPWRVRSPDALTGRISPNTSSNG
jgi:hypothetical protein